MNVVKKKEHYVHCSRVLVLQKPLRLFLLKDSRHCTNFWHVEKSTCRWDTTSSFWNATTMLYHSWKMAVLQDLILPLWAASLERFTSISAEDKFAPVRYLDCLDILRCKTHAMVLQLMCHTCRVGRYAKHSLLQWTHSFEHSIIEASYSPFCFIAF